MSLGLASVPPLPSRGGRCGCQDGPGLGLQYREQRDRAGHGFILVLFVGSQLSFSRTVSQVVDALLKFVIGAKINNPASGVRSKRATDRIQHSIENVCLKCHMPDSITQSMASYAR